MFCRSLLKRGDKVGPSVSQLRGGQSVRARGLSFSFRPIIGLAERPAEHTAQLLELANSCRERKAVAVDLAADERKERSELVFCEVFAGHVQG